MRKRYQKGSLSKVGSVWIAQWWEDGHRRKRTLGRVLEMTKAKAQLELATILSPINGRKNLLSEKANMGEFVRQVYLPFYRRKWKESTAGTNESRLRFHVLSEFSGRTLGSFTRNELQDFLDRKATAGLSFYVVDHLRWDLRQIFRLATEEGYLPRNPATLLFTPSGALRYPKRQMNREEVRLFFSVLELRERLIGGMAILAGMRPGEIFGLKWVHLEEDHADVRQRIYRGKVDSPKTARSLRKVGFPKGLQEWIRHWRSCSIDPTPDAWVFPSERMKTPVTKDNCWRRHFLPKLKEVGLEWANFQVMRRTHASLMRELDIDPKIVADQLGHSLDVNLNVYTQTSLGKRKEALDTLETVLRVM